MEVFSPVAALAASLIDEPESQNSTRIEENISGELFNKPAAKAEKTDTRNKEEVHKKTSNKAKETGKAPDLIPAKKTKNDHESMNPAKQTKNDYEILVPAKEKAKPEAKAAEEAKAKEEQAAKEKEDLAKIEKEKQEALRIEAERQAQAARANDAEAAAAEAEYREAHQKRLELEQLLEEKLKEKGLRDQKKQSEKSLNQEKSNKLKDTEENKLEDEKEEGFLDKIKNFFTGDDDLDRMMADFRAEIPTELTQEEIDAGLIMLPPLNKPGEESPRTVSFRSAFRSMAFWRDTSDIDEETGLEMSDEEIPQAVGAGETVNLSGKKFNIITRFDTSNVGGPIQPYQYFDIHLDKKLTVNNPSELKSLYYQGREIAKPEYIKNENKIRYNIQGTIPENIQVPVNIPVDYKDGPITLDKDGTFTVINKVSGLGINNPPRDLVPQKVDRNGNLAGSIIEPGRHDVTQVVEPDDKNYRVTMDGYATPVVENGELKGFNWKFLVGSNRDLKDLKFKANFTTVKGSGLGKIEKFKINGQDPGDLIKPNNLNGSLGIVDSVHYSQKGSATEVTYTFYTPKTEKQTSYMLDISNMVNGKLGAKRVLANQGYPIEKVKDGTPSRVGMNNRTTILGKFLNNDNAQWTVTDAVSTGDNTGGNENKGLPLEDRSLGDNQILQTSKVATYGLDTDEKSSTYGQMVVKKGEVSVDSIPPKESNPNGKQDVGTIAVYEYDTKLTGNGSYTVGGVAISKEEDLRVNQEWSLDPGAKMPDQEIKAVDPANENNVLGTKKLDSSKDNGTTRDFTIPNVKVWNIDDQGNATRVQPKLVQDLPKTVGQFQYLENYNYYKPIEGVYFIQNRANQQIDKKFGSFTLLKTDKNGKPLPGAKFRLFRGPEVTTDKDGKARFSNIEPGDYNIIETQAPPGYKLADNVNFRVDLEGKILKTGGPGTITGGQTPTKTIKHKQYPGYMNAMHYGSIDDQGNITTYIYLKALGNVNNGSTNKPTRVNISSTNANDLKVEVFDVDPVKRFDIQRAMNLQTVSTSGLNPVLNQGNYHPIKGNYLDASKNSYTFNIPQERITNDWGFMVKVTAKKDTNAQTTPAISYDWVTDNGRKGEAELKNNNIALSSVSAGQETIITIPNQPFDQKSIKITKVRTDKTNLSGATFVLKDSEGNPIETKVSGDDGNVDFGKHPEGRYTIEELEGPEGYIESQLVFDVLVDKSKQVTYSPRFKHSNAEPVKGVDYWIEDEVVKDDESRAKIIKVNQEIKLSENGYGEIGTRTGVWEAYGYESYTYKANIELGEVTKDKRFEIQFDQNLDLTQYVNKIPSIYNKEGQEIAKPYMDYQTNLLTYVFTDKASGQVKFDLTIDGIIPSKFYAKTSGTYDFKIVAGPGLTSSEIQGNQVLPFTVQAYYGVYDTGTNNANQAYYFRDVYKEGDDWYVKAIAYYNPLSYDRGARTLRFNWMSTNWDPNKNIVNWKGIGIKPAFDLEEVKIYKTYPGKGINPSTEGNTTLKTTNAMHMPLSMGIKPENDPYTYHLVHTSRINAQDTKNYQNREGNITLNYIPSQINYDAALNTRSPLQISMPGISNQGEGYVIEQTFKVTNLDVFTSKFRAFYMGTGGLESAFASKVNTNVTAAEQTKQEIPKFYTQKVMMANEKYEPGKFKIKKYNESDQKPLQGATFSLEDKNKNKIYRTTDGEGGLSFDNIKPGTYILKEEEAPENYIKSDKTWQVYVAKDGTVTITDIELGSEGSIIGKDLELKVSNKPKGQDFVVYKKGDQGQPLKDAKFIIKKVDDKTVIREATSDQNGKVAFVPKLANGTYILEEAEAPTGYKKLDKKWVLVVSDTGVKVHEYIKQSSTESGEKINSLLREEGTHWVDIAKRPVGGRFSGLDDPRFTGYVNNSQVPSKVGTRIVGINKTKKFVVQRFVINPEAASVGKSKVQIYREPLSSNNMEWYNDETFKIYKLDKAVAGRAGDIKLDNYEVTELNKTDYTKSNVTKPGEDPQRLQLELPATDKPIVIDVKIPYTDESGAVGTGIDYWENVGTPNEKVYWKPDYYEYVSDIVEGEIVPSEKEDSIIGGLISEGSLEVKNVKNRHEFEFTKIKENTTDAVSGATFKLTGPKKSDDDLGQEHWSHSGTDGKVNFKDLLPGTYKLEETGAAQGYELANTNWTVTILDDGKVYIKDNNQGDQVADNNPEIKWQKVDVTNTNKDNRVNAGTEYANIKEKKAFTNIVEVNKATNKFRQVFVLNRAPENLNNPELQIHAQPEDRDITNKNTRIISINEVGVDSQPNDIKNIGKSVPYNVETIFVKGHNRLRINTDIKKATPIAITIETEMPTTGRVGTGMDFTNYTNTYWAAESYQDMNSFVLEPIKVSEVDKNSKLVVPNDWAKPAKTSAPTTRSAEILEEAGIQPISLMRTMYENPEALEILENLVGTPVGAGDINPYNIEASNANITVSAGDVNTTDGTRNINISVKPNEGTKPGSTNGKNLQYVFMIDRSRDQALNIRTADTPTIDKNINKFLTDLAEKAKNTNTSVDVTFIEYSKNGSRVLGSYNQSLADLYNSANSFTYNMKTNSFNDRNNVTAKDILGKLGISSRTDVRNKDKDDGSQVLNKNIANYYRQIIGSGKKYDKKYVLNVANFDAATATYYLENPNNPYSTKKYYAAENNWIFRDTTKPAQDRFESYVLHISQKGGNTGYESYMSTNSGTLLYEKDTATTTNGIYTYKNFLESNLMKKEDFQSSGQVEEYLVKDAKINVDLNQNVVLKQGPSADKGSLNVLPSNDGFTLSGINLKKGEVLNLSYTIGLTDSATNNKDYNIHRTMQYTPNNGNPVNLDNNLITRRNLERYNVSLIANNGSGQVTNTSVNKGENYSLPQCDFTAPSGQEFDYWLVYGQRHQPGDSIQITEDTKVIAQWKANATPQPQKHNIRTSVTGNIGGSVTADPTSQEKGKTVTITVKPDKGYETTSLTLNGQPIGPQLKPDGTYTFKMGDKDVHVIATFNKKEVVPKESYDIGVDDNNNGKKVVVYTRTEPNKSEAGKLVEFTVTPFDDYVITDVYVKLADGSGNVEPLKQEGNKYSFTMPNQAVNIYANVKRVQPPQGTYLVGINPSITNGSVTTEPRRPYPNTVVRITVTPRQGYSLESLSVTKQWGGNVEVKYDNEGPYFVMPSENVTVYAKFKEGQGPTPDPSQPDDDKLGYLIYDPSDPNNIIKKDTKITNKRAGLELNVFKKTIYGRPLEGAEFKLEKTDETYKNVDSSFKPATGVSDGNGNVKFMRDGKLVKLQTGYYTIEEITPPLGFKKATSKWRIEVKDDQKKIHATYLGPKQTPSQYLDSDKANLGETANDKIKTASRIIHIDTGSKTFVQRTIIDLRGYTGEDVNVQINPKYPREEIDRPGVAPVTIKEGVKTAYRTTYQINNAGKGNLDTDDILRNYDLSKPGVSMVNTARWRPFDWGFDEDQLNLKPGGVYFIDIEGYYDDSIIDKTVTNQTKRDDNYNVLDAQGNIIPDKQANDIQPGKVDPYERKDIDTNDLAKLQIDFKLYSGARKFYQLKYNPQVQEKFEYKTFDKASYQGGATEVGKYIKANLISQGYSEKDADEFVNKWTKGKINGDKYKNFIGKKVKVNETDKNYLTTGVIYPSVDKNVKTIETITTAADISSMYTTNTDKPIEIPKEGLDIPNEEESYNITFSKHGKDNPGIDNNDASVTENRLEGAIFKLQYLFQGDYVDLPGSYVSSAFNGYFGFRGLKPGRYRLMEVQAPKGYRPINDAIIHMTIAYTDKEITVQDPKDPSKNKIIPKGGYITLEYNNSNGIVQYAGDNASGSGKLVDYVTSATAKNMGKIINEKPGKGKVTIEKKDDDGTLIPGAEFKLTRLSKKEEKKNDGQSGENPVQNEQGVEKTAYQYTGTVGKDGKLEFDKLPIGQYKLEETKPAPGHINTGQIWNFTVGGKDLDPYSGDIKPTGTDQGSNITMTSTMNITKPDKVNDKTTSDKEIHPNFSQMLDYEIKFNLTKGTVINPGDYFTVKLPESIDLKGIFKDKKVDGLDIFADGVGTIAKASYDYAKGEITYTFTNYAKSYQLLDFNTSLTAHINPDKVKISTENVGVGIGIKKGENKVEPSNTDKIIKVVYERGVKQSALDNVGGNYYQVNLASKITEFDPQSGKFTHIIYLNPNGKLTGAPKFEYYPGTDVDNMRLEVFETDISNNDKLDKNMPASYGVNLDGKTPVVNYYYNRPVNNTNRARVDFTRNDKSSYIVRITGNIRGEDKSSYRPLSYLRSYYDDGSDFQWAYTYNEVFASYGEATAKAELTISAINPKNRILFKKVDQEHHALAGAKFKLKKLAEGTEATVEQNWTDVPNSEQVTPETGVIEYNTLTKGKYALVEVEAPEGYNKIEGHIQEFEVTETGTIIKSKKPTQTRIREEDEIIGIEPIEVINYKDIEFVKVDGADGKKLEGAEFEVYYKEKETDKDYGPLKVNNAQGKEETMKVRSDKDGKFKLNIYKNGYYALKETKAPKDYTKIPGYIREFKLENGKVQVLEKDPLKASQRVGKNALMESQIIEVDKKNGTFKQRIIINPSHKEWKFDTDTHLRLFENNNWEIAKDENQKRMFKAAVLKEGKTLDSLKDTDFKDATARDNVNDGIIKYTIRDLYGSANYKGPEEGKSILTTKDSIVIEYVGKLKDNSTVAEIKNQIRADLTILDDTKYKLDMEQITNNDGKGIYVDKHESRPIVVENRKSEYPHTGGMGTLIFTLAGILLMSAAAYVYSRKRGESYDE